MSRQFFTAIPGQRPAQFLGESSDRLRQSACHRESAVAGQRRSVLGARDQPVAVFTREVDQHREPAAAFDQRADRRALQPDEQISFRKTEAGPGGLGVAEDRLALLSLIGNVRPALLGALAAD